MAGVQVEQKTYEMPPREGMSIAHFLTVADVERSARYYEKVFGARILTMGDGNAPPYLQLANIWIILNVGGGSTPDKGSSGEKSVSDKSEGSSASESKGSDSNTSIPFAFRSSFMAVVVGGIISSARGSNVAGSYSLTPKSMLASIRARARVTGRPISNPVPVSVSPRRTTIQTTSGGRAPSAMRTPISCVRSFTEYAITA